MRLTRDQWIPVSREFRAPSNSPVVSLSMKLYSNCLVLVGSRNRFERDLHNQTKINWYKLTININYDGSNECEMFLSW